MSVSKGNQKLGAVPNVSLPPVKACGNCKHCKHDCYALKSYRMYPSVRQSWDNNLSLARQKPTAYFGMVREFLAKRSPRFFRWHVSGDILHQTYLENMCKIAREFPETAFLAFTKMHMLDYSDLPDNLTIVFSAWPGMPVGEGMPIAWMQDGTETRVPDNALECPGNCESCGMCFNLKSIGRDVVFHKH